MCNTTYFNEFRKHLPPKDDVDKGETEVTAKPGRDKEAKETTTEATVEDRKEDRKEEKEKKEEKEG